MFWGCYDIGRRTGVAAVRHIIDGYDYAVTKGWEEVGRICLTHSFPIKDIEADIGKKDITTEQYNFIEHFLDTIVYDEYDSVMHWQMQKDFVSWKKGS